MISRAAVRRTLRNEESQSKSGVNSTQNLDIRNGELGSISGLSGVVANRDGSGGTLGSRLGGSGESSGTV